jgi:uncharacterized protein involved in exopolysaccharide biosynthesis
MHITPPSESLGKTGPFSVAAFRRHGLWSLAVAAASGLLAFLVSFAIAPVYIGQAVLLPVKGSSGAGSLFQLPSALGELASMAGVSAGAGDATEALETLQSRALAERFIKEHGLLDTLVQPSLLRRVIGRSTEIPPTKELNLAITRFRESIVNVVEDKRTGVVHLSVFWKDPNLAADWANGLVSLVNQELRAKALDESKRRLDYLNAEAERTNVVGVKEAVYRVIEAEIKAMMLANARSEFAFRVIDPAAPPERDDYVRPNRAAFLLVGFFLGGLVTIVIRQRRSRAG